MISKLENDVLKLEVDNIGAELLSIKSAHDKYEYLWQGDPLYLGMRAPVLFPVIGGLEGGKYRIGDNVFEMCTHGFARNMEFDMINSGENILEYNFGSNAETLKLYPYEFRLQITYILIKNMLTVMYTIKNTDNRAIWFSIGAHPAFNCPLNGDSEIEDYYVEFEKYEYSDRLFVHDSMLTGKKELFLNNEKSIGLTDTLFDQKALVFQGLQSESATLRCRKSKKAVTVLFQGFPYLAFWSAKGGAPLLCIEPWHGIPSSRGENLDFREKRGVIKLEEGKLFNCEFKMIFE